MRVKRQESRVESQRTISPRLSLRARILTPGSRLPAPLPRGLTLIELLVVIIILTTLVSAAIPLLAPTNDDRRLREASRGVNAFISAAQMKAVQLQRPVGVAIKRLSQDTNTTTNPIHDDNAVSVELFYVEQPAPYRGFDRTSSAMVARHPNRTGEVLIQFVTRGNSSTSDDLPVGWDADLFPPGVIRPGDVVEIDGTQYELIWETTSPSGWARIQLNAQTGFYESTTGTVARIEARPINDTGQMINIEFDDNGDRMRDLGIGVSPAGPNRPYWTNPASYKILRQPMPTSAEPFQLPEGTAIDLRASGIGENDYFYVPGVHDNPEGVLIMFAPEGRVSRVLFSRKPNLDERFDEPVTDNLYLLVGRRENAPPPTVANDLTLDAGTFSPPKTEEQLQELKQTVNWLRSESRWIAIGPQSGRVVTIENAFVNIQNLATSPPDETTRNAQIKASREFAREMKQVGGR
jgi:prepilin-type N-terminal cleavage/methylation domain-containing protein